MKKIFGLIIMVLTLITLLGCECKDRVDDGYVRIYYERSDRDYDGWGLWYWGDVAAPSDQSGSWPEGGSLFPYKWRRKVCIDIELSSDTSKHIGFVIMKPEDGTTDGGEKHFNFLDRYNKLYVFEGDDTVYISKKKDIASGISGAQIISANQISTTFINVDVTAITAADLKIKDKNGQPYEITDITVEGDDTVVIDLADTIDFELTPFEVTYKKYSVTAVAGYKYIDSLYSYSGDDLGATYADGNVDFKIWAPKASSVIVDIYADHLQADPVQSVNLSKFESDNWQGVWQVTLDAPNDEIVDYKNYFYQYRITNDGVEKRCLDPYAKSSALFTANSSGDVAEGMDDVGRGAIIDRNDLIDVKPANMTAYSKREDAIIYEVHVRDFTSDPDLDLTASKGSYDAFVENLQKIKDLGVTHVQILPVNSYYYGDETNREMSYAWESRGENYNWGYDPHGYFSVEGMYSEDPSDPVLRMNELRNLINAIHDAEMGVILDVVYNHTALISILEDITPNYYYFMDANLNPKDSFGGGLMGTTHAMTKKLIVDAVAYWTSEFKVDGFRFDMMGSMDSQSVQAAYDEASAINPDILFIGEGWRTFSGDDGESAEPADQDWMDKVDFVGVFSDEIRNELKSGFGIEGQPRFITGGPRNVDLIFNNIIAKPGNITEDDPGDVVQYIAAHDNMTLHDVVAYSANLNPEIPAEEDEIHQRIRLGNTLILTSQGIAFLHAGQEMGRTKQFKSSPLPDYDDNKITSTPVGDFVHDSFDSSDQINMLDWSMRDTEPGRITYEMTRGLIAIRKSTDAFRLGSAELIATNVEQIKDIDQLEEDLVIGYKCTNSANTEAYYIFVNADSVERNFTVSGAEFNNGTCLLDHDEAAADGIPMPSGVAITADTVTLEPLTATIIRVNL